MNIMSEVYADLLLLYIEGRLRSRLRCRLIQVVILCYRVGEPTAA